MIVKYRVEVSKPVTGQLIFQVLEKFVGTNADGFGFSAELLRADDDGNHYRIGSKTTSPLLDYVIGVGEEAQSEISMTAVYTNIFILSWKYSRNVSVIDVSLKGCEEAATRLRRSRDNFQAALEKAINEADASHS